MNSPNETGFTGSRGDAAERHTKELAQRLNSLLDGAHAATQLVACGPVAIPPLKRFLFQGKPSVVYQPRRWAVEALGGLGAKDVLIEYLIWKKDISDPAVRMAEEAVENAAARELAKWQTKDVLDILLKLALPRFRSGIIEALGQFGCLEAIPYFAGALEDDMCQAAAENALRALGRQAELALVTAARTLLPSPDEERPSSLRRRRKALELLAELGPSPETWLFLKPLLSDLDPGVVTGAAKIAAIYGDRQDKVTAVDRLLNALPGADWFLRSEIQACLVSLYREGKPRIEQEIANRNALPDAERIADSSLRTLLGVRRRAGPGLPQQGSME